MPQVDTLSGPALRLHLVELFVAHDDPRAAVIRAREAEAYIVGAAQIRITTVSKEEPHDCAAEKAEDAPAGIGDGPADGIRPSQDADVLGSPEPGDAGDDGALQPGDATSAPALDEAAVAPSESEPQSHSLTLLWTPERLVELERHIAAGLHYAAIAEALGVSVGAIRGQVSVRGFAKVYPRKRSGALLYEPYPLDRPWPPVTLTSATQPVRNAEFNSRQQALADHADPQWRDKADIDELRRMLDAGLNFVEIAEKFRAPAWREIRNLAREHGLLVQSASGTWMRPDNPVGLNAPTGKEKMRKCLRCGVEFWSHGPGNRMCGDCRTATANTYDPTASVA